MAHRYCTAWMYLSFYTVVVLLDGHNLEMLLNTRKGKTVILDNMNSQVQLISCVHTNIHGIPKICKKLASYILKKLWCIN